MRAQAKLQSGSMSLWRVEVDGEPVLAGLSRDAAEDAARALDKVLDQDLLVVEHLVGQVEVLNSVVLVLTSVLFRRLGKAETLDILKEAKIQAVELS